MKRDGVIEKMVTALRALPEDIELECAEDVINDVLNELDADEPQSIPNLNWAVDAAFQSAALTMQRVLDGVHKTLTMGQAFYYFSDNSDSKYFAIPQNATPACSHEPCDTGIPGGKQWCKKCGADIA